MNLILILLEIIFVILTIVQMRFGLAGHGYLVSRKKPPFWFWMSIAMWWIVCICILTVGVVF